MVALALQTRTAPYVPWRTTGQYRGAAADAAGTIFGVSVVGNGSISTSHGASVSKDIVIAPPPPPFPPPAP